MVVAAIDGVIRGSVALNHGAAANRSLLGWQSADRKVHKMEYLIVLGVASMIALYTVIIQRCLRDA